VTYAGPFGLPKAGAQIIVRTGEISVPASAYTFGARRESAGAEESKMRGLLREVVAIRKAGKKV
jgi:hypothetical protein